MKPRHSATMVARPRAGLIVNRNSTPASRSDEVDGLREQFLKSLAAISRGMATLRQCVVQLLDMDVDREEMVAWAVQAGYSDAYVRSLLSQVLVAAGRRERATGAGRKTSPEAMSLMRYAVRHYHQQAPKVLLAAYRAAVKLALERRRQQAAG